MPFKESKRFTLNQLGTFSNGVNFGKESMGSGWGLINVKDIFRSGIRLELDRLDKVRVSEQKKIQTYTVLQNDLFFVRSSVKRDGIGLVAYSRTDEPEVVHCGFVIRFRTTSDKANPVFLAYALRSPFFRETLKAISSGTAIVNISQKVLGSVEIELPDASRQASIVKILSAYDDLIENNIRRIKLAKNIAETIFKRARNHSGKFWKLVPISSLYAGLYDGPHATPKPSESGPIFLGIQNVTERGELVLASIRHIAERDFATWTRRVLPAPGDIVFTYEATLHRYGMIREGFRGCLGRRLALIRPDLERVDPHFLLYSMLDEEWRREVTSKIILGATVDRVPLTTFPRFQLRVPTLAVQREIGASIRACEDLADNCSRQNRILRATRDFLLPKLISGEIGVEKSETETASQIS
jgi:type I restriction enzyme, S subunit